MKKRYNFTLDEDVMDWLRLHARENRTTCSAFINQMLGKLRGGKPKLKSVPTKSYRGTT